MKPALSSLASTASWSAVLLAILALAGCGGSTGPAGPAGSSGTDNESGITADPTLTATDNSPGIVVTITGITGGTGSGGTFRPGDKPAVTFTLKKTNNTAWHLGEMGSGRIFISGPTNNYQRVVPSISDVITRAVRVDDGTYTYTFASGLPSTYAAPYNDSTAHGTGDGERTGQALIDGAYTVGLAITWNYTVDGVSKRDAGNATKEFLIGATASLATREVVKNDNCNTCHVRIEAHGGSYRDTKMCVLCHTAGAEDRANEYPSAGGNPGTSIEFKEMIHRIHNGVHLPSVNGVATNIDGSRKYDATAVDNIIIGRNGTPYDFSAAVFPVFPSFSSAMPRDAGYSGLTSGQKTLESRINQGVVACYKCHGDPDGAGSKTAPSQGDQCNSVPSRRACGSCHDDIDWTKPYTANGMTMPAQADDTACGTCHATSGTTLGSGIAVTGGTVPSTPLAHIHPMSDPAVIDGADSYNPGLNFEITDVTGAAGAFFVAGEKPRITFEITNQAGADVPLYSLGSINTVLNGPTENRQLVFPLSAPKAVTISLCDFSGRLVASSTSNKGSMSRVVGSAASEVLKVQFTGATAFTVTAGSAGAARGAGTLQASPSTNPASSSLSAVELTTSAAVQWIRVVFSSSTAFTVEGDGGSNGATWTSMGAAGTMPAATNASTRWTSTDGSVAFTLTSGGTAFANTNTIYLSVFQTSSNTHKFAIVAGRTSFAIGDRFYYETVQNSLTSYDYALPMDLVTEYLGDGNNTIGQTFTAGNLPVYWGRESVWERTLMPAAVGTLTANVAARARYVDLSAVTGLAAGDTVCIDDAGTEEYIVVGSVSGTRVWFRTPLRYSHNSGATVHEPTMTRRFEGTDYTLDPVTGVLTTVTAAGAGNAMVISYRTDGAFGWYRHAGDTRQDVFQPPPNDSPDLGEESGEWSGLALLSGTYTAAVWGQRPVYVTANNETQTYNYAATAALADFRYGSAGSTEPYALISSEENCDKCHDGFFFHGGSRKGNDACAMCHSVAGLEDWPAYAGGTPQATPGVTATFRGMLHKIHMGKELTNASTYTVVGNSGTPHTYEAVVFPPLPGEAKNCEVCHGTGNTAWKAPAEREHPDQTTPTKEWKEACATCHDSDDAATHVEAMTTSSGAESCATCHSAGQVHGVDTVHKNR